MNTVAIASLLSLALLGCSRSESAPAGASTAEPIANRPAPVANAPGSVPAPSEEQAVALARLWLGDVSQVDVIGTGPALRRMYEHVELEVAYATEPAHRCPRTFETVSRESAVDCAVREIGWISGVMSQELDASAVKPLTGAARDVVAFLEPGAVRALDTPLRVELTIDLDADRLARIRRVRISDQ